MNDRLSQNGIRHQAVSYGNVETLYQVVDHWKRDGMSPSYQDNRWRVLQKNNTKKKEAKEENAHN